MKSCNLKILRKKAFVKFDSYGMCHITRPKLFDKNKLSQHFYQKKTKPLKYTNKSQLKYESSMLHCRKQRLLGYTIRLKKL